MAKLSKAIIAAILAIHAAPAGFIMMTQDEGKPLVEAGLATVDTANVDGNKAAVSLTDAGKAAAAEHAPKDGEGDSTDAASFEIEDGIAIPANSTRKGREGGYPFDKLEVGQSFHVAKTAANPDPASRLASSASGARAKWAEKTGEQETVNVNVYKRGEDGKSYVKDDDGKRVVERTESLTRDKMKLTRDFVVKSVDASDPKGEGARVWRIALPAEA